MVAGANTFNGWGMVYTLIYLIILGWKFTKDTKNAMTISRVNRILKAGVRDFVSLLYPSLCICCLERAVTENQLMCVVCAMEIPYTDHFEDQDNKVVQHFYGRIPINHGAALLYFSKNSKVKNMLYNFKYGGIKNIGKVLGEQIGRKISQSDHFNNLDLIIPIPIHIDKRIRRGFNQTEIIANGISEICDLEVNSKILIKLFDTETQTYKNRIQRMQNVDNTLGIKNKRLIRDKNILLVDDVITTGATLEASGKVLLSNGARSVSVVTAGAAVSGFL
jgi:ComF family protein